MNTIFFGTTNYFIDKNRKNSRSLTKFHIYNDKRECIGYIRDKKTFLQKITGLNIFPSVFEIRNVNGVLKASLSCTFQGLFRLIVITDDNGKKIGSIKQQFSFFKQNLEILNASNEIIAVICGNKRDWYFTINNATKSEIGEIKKSEKTIRKSVAKSRYKFDVIINEIQSSNEDKVAILASAFTINMVL